MGDCHDFPKECRFFFRRTRSSAPDPVSNEFRSCRLQGALDRDQRVRRYTCDTVLGFEAAHRRDRDMSTLGEILLFETKQRAGGSYLFGFYHEQ